jgi:putative ABC transport system permease protein
MIRYLPIVWAGLWRNRLRSGLTLLTIMVAFTTYGLLRGFMDAHRVDTAQGRTLQVLPRHRGAGGLPISYLRTLQGIEGIREITYASGVAGYYQRPDQPVFGTAIPADGSWFHVTRSQIIDESSIDAFAASRTGAIVGEDLMKKLGLSVGDRLPVVVGGPGDADSLTWIFDIVGTWDFIDETWSSEMAFVRYDYIDEARVGQKGTVLFYLLSVDDPSRLAELAVTIDEALKNAPVSTRTTNQRDNIDNYLNRITGLNRFIDGIVLTAFLTILIVTGGTMMQAIRERVPEFAVMRSFGYPTHVITLIAMAESNALCVVGAVVGLGVAQLLLPWLQPPGPPLTIPIDTLAVGLVIAVGMGIASATLPSVHVSRSSVVDALSGR